VAGDSTVMVAVTAPEFVKARSGFIYIVLFILFGFFIKSTPLQQQK